MKAFTTDLTALIYDARTWSEETFGPGDRLQGVFAHIREELDEIEENPKDLSEWADAFILVIDGAWRSGAEPEQIVEAILAKYAKNRARTWPDWRTADPNKPINHVRGVED